MVAALEGVRVEKDGALNHGQSGQRGEWPGAVAVAGGLFSDGIGDAMRIPEEIHVLFIAGFGPIVRDGTASRELYGKALGIAFKEETDGYLHTESLPGARSFALWPLSQAAQSCFGNDSWPADIPIPQAWLEFDVENLEQATAKLQLHGYRLLLQNKKEPWGQTVTRFLSPEGLLLGVAYTPAMRAEKL